VGFFIPGLFGRFVLFGWSFSGFLIFYLFYYGERFVGVFFSTGGFGFPFFNLSFLCCFPCSCSSLALLIGWVYRDDNDDVSCSCYILDWTGFDYGYRGISYKKHDAM
jgi:hypothetical protein